MFRLQNDVISINKDVFNVSYNFSTSYCEHSMWYVSLNATFRENHSHNKDEVWSQGSATGNKSLLFARPTQSSKRREPKTRFLTQKAASVFFGVRVWIHRWDGRWCWGRTIMVPWSIICASIAELRGRRWRQWTWIGPACWGEGPWVSFLIFLPKPFQVGLECRSLLLQGEETLLHFVKL